MIKAIIFDLNGIFLKSERLSDRIEKKYGIPGDKFYPALKKVLAIARKSGDIPFFELLEPELKKLNFQFSEKEFFGFWFSGEKLVPEVLKYVKELRKKRIKIFILSRNFKERTEYYRKNFSEISNNIDKAYFSWETGLVKPDPRAYKTILKEHKLKPEECIYFDDVDENVEAAKNLGIKAAKYKDLKFAKKFIAEYEQNNKS